LKVRLIDDPEAMYELEQDWDALASKSEFATVFSTSGFMRAWWKAFGGSRKLHLVLVEDGGSLRLAAPFYSDNAVPRVWRLIGDIRADYLNFVFAAGDGESLKSLWGWLGSHDGWDSMILRRLPGDSAILRHFPKALAHSWTRARRIKDGADVRFPLSWMERYEEHLWIDRTALDALSGLVEGSKYQRAIRGLGQLGSLKFETTFERRRIQERLPAFMDLHIAQWDAKGDPSLFLEAENRNFYSLLAEEPKLAGSVRFDALTVDDRLVAGHFGFSWRGRLHHYKTTYDIALSSHKRPGLLLLAYMFRQVCAEDLQEWDFGQGKEPYKSEFASGIRGTSSLVVRRSRVQSALEWMRRDAPCTRCGRRISCPHLGRA
jgi:CelD/BcsL family acetyltransferase involved in cellulose biosynthesis